MPFEVQADPTALSYATLEAAELADERRGGGAAFLDLDEDEQLQQLVAASLDIDTSDWKGQRSTTTQEREWPRTGTVYSPDAWPQLVVDATIELAFDRATKAAAAPATTAPTETGPLKRRKIGPIEREWFAPPTVDATTQARYPELVQRMLAPLIRAVDAAASSEWGMSVAVRSS